jgi:hypothetical protein
MEVMCRAPNLIRKQMKECCCRMVDEEFPAKWLVYPPLPPDVERYYSFESPSYCNPIVTSSCRITEPPRLKMKRLQRQQNESVEKKEPAPLTESAGATHKNTNKPWQAWYPR